MINESNFIKDNSPSTADGSPANIIFLIATSSGTTKKVFAKIKKEEGGRLFFDFFVKNEEGRIVPILDFSRLLFIGCKYDGKLGPKIRAGGSLFFFRREGDSKRPFIKTGRIISISQ